MQDPSVEVGDEDLDVGQRIEEGEENRGDGELEEQQGRDLDWRGGVKPSGQDDVQLEEYLEQDEDELEEEEEEDFVLPLVERKEVPSAASLKSKKTRKRSQVCLFSWIKATGNYQTHNVPEIGLSSSSSSSS